MHMSLAGWRKIFLGGMFHVKYVIGGILLPEVNMINKKIFSPAGSEITSPLAEHLAAFIMTTRAHVVAMMDSRTEEDDSVFNVHATSAMSTLEMLSALVGDFVLESTSMPD